MTLAPLPPKTHSMLRQASEASTPRRVFQCAVFKDASWNQFVELWLPRVHVFVEEALGAYGVEPAPVVLPMPDGMHVAGATASFNPMNGQVTLCPSVQGNPGQILEKLTHELTHGSLALFPEGDPFMEEGYVDYMVWVMAHAPYWEPYKQGMIAAAALNIENRRERAMKDQSDYERKRWAGGLFAAVAKGPTMIGSYRLKKSVGDFTW